MVYLFIGQDNAAKDLQLKKLKEEFLPGKFREFNSDTLYSRELKLPVLQERILSLPVQSATRMLVIKDAQALSEAVKEFLLEYVKNPHPSIILVLDILHDSFRDSFVQGLKRHASQIFRSKEEEKLDTFFLNRQIKLRKTDSALRVLNQILETGEKPELILGGLRYCYETEVALPAEVRKRLSLLLACDNDVKTGRLPAHLALEKLVVNLCHVK